VPCDTPLLPLAVTQCSFQDGGTGAFTSQGCGTGLTFIRSNTQCNNQAGSPQSCNTATWANLSGSGTPNPGYLNSTIQNAANGGGACGGGGILTSGQQAGTNNGMVDSTFKVLADTFVANRSATLSEDVCPAGGCDGSAPLYRKEGGGWEVAVAMIRTPCPPGAMSGTYEVLTFTKFVITQIFYKQDGCEIAPNPDPQARTYCYNPDGSKRKDNDLRAVFGYFRCDRLGEVASRDPLPRTALATRLRLVQ
jgi:hypothetical protein